MSIFPFLINFPTSCPFSRIIYENTHILKLDNVRVNFSYETRLSYKWVTKKVDIHMVELVWAFCHASKVDMAFLNKKMLVWTCIA